MNLLPRTPDQLHALVERLLRFTMTRRAVMDQDSAPFAYLQHSFFEDASQQRDCVVWANRGGGKTQLGAIATFLDLVFKPGIQVRILGGSLDQSSKMYAYLRRLLMLEPWRDLVDGRLTGQFVQLHNGSRAEILAQSQRAVRGQRVHRLRCDEVELFDDEVWEAAQMVTRSGRCGDVYVHASVEALSTMHRPFGLMQRLVDDTTGERPRRRLFRWSVLDVLERCPPQRPCETCALFIDCRGGAKQARGFIGIDDAIDQMQRVGRETWESEMLCRRPSRRDLVYPEFDPVVHVRAFDAATADASDPDRYTWLGGMDFGYRAPTVFLWAAWDRANDLLIIVDEYVATERTVGHHIKEVQRRAHPHPGWIGADPAGAQRSEQTGLSPIAVWREAGFRVKAASRSIEYGVELVRRRLRAGDGGVGMVIDPRCGGLIRALRTYHFAPDRMDDPLPVKDGPDHAADALRYLVVNLDGGSGRVVQRRY